MQSEHPVKKSQRLYHPLNKSPRAPRYTWSSSLEGERKASKLQCYITPSPPPLPSASFARKNITLSNNIAVVQMIFKNTNFTNPRPL